MTHAPGRPEPWVRVFVFAIAALFGLSVHVHGLSAVFGPRSIDDAVHAARGLTRAFVMIGTGLDVTAPPGPADALVILGGGTTREAAGAALLAIVGPRLVTITYGANDPRTPTLLYAAGIPPEGVHIVRGPRDTREEARVVLAYLNAQGARSAVLVTDAAHSRRARAAWECAIRIYGGPSLLLADASPTAAAPMDLARWWETPETARYVLGERVKGAITALTGC
jgi:uncharacterized SAM-binding protein YcdF (DUF218 family)